MKEYNAYLFDADGTLMDTKELIYRSFVRMGEVMGVRLPDRPAVEATIGLPLVRQVRDLLGSDLTEADYARAMEAYGDYMMEVYPKHLAAFPGVSEGLATLAAMGKKLAVVTSRRKPSLVKFLDVLGIGKYFQVMVTPEDTDRHKPDPEPALLAMRLLDVRPEETVFVGDAEFDIACGHAAGTDTAFVTWGNMDPTVWKVQPDFVATTFAELLP